MDYKAERDRRGLTLAQVAALIPYATGTISDLERTGKGSDRLRKALDQLYGNRNTPSFTEEESPAEYLVDDLIAEAQEIRERAARLEMKALKLKPKSGLTEEQIKRAEKIIKQMERTEAEVSATLARRGIAAGDKKEISSASAEDVAKKNLGEAVSYVTTRQSKKPSADKSSTASGVQPPASRESTSQGADPKQHSDS